MAMIMESTFLDAIVREKRRVVLSKREFYARIKEQLSLVTYTRYGLFKKAVSKRGKLNLIAEIKKASPSKGLIREDFDVIEIAHIYHNQGVAAISVLTEEKYFLGKPLYIKKVADWGNLPVLAKDFIVDEGQMYEARLNGASAVLLIAAILDDVTMRAFLKTAARMDLDCLVEVHTREELFRAVDCGAEIIGINNRDLRSFQVDLAVAETLIPQVPRGIISVVESGIQTNDDIRRITALGANAVLIGETFMRERDIARKMKEVMYG